MSKPSILRIDPIFIIITVTKNDYEGTLETHKSLLRQKYSNWLHLIIDGNSKFDVVRKLEDLASSKTIIKSEEDSGIYNAMNKAWNLTPDDCWLIYLNSGDYFIDEFALSRLSSEILQNNAVKIFIAPFEEKSANGDSWITKLVSEPSKLNQLFCWGYASHQSMVIHKEVFVTLQGFDETYRVAADWDFYVRAIENFSSRKISQSFSCFKLGGYSMQNINLAHKELISLRRNHLKLDFRRKVNSYVWEALFSNSISSRSLIGNFLRFLFLIPYFIFVTLDVISRIFQKNLRLVNEQILRTRRIKNNNLKIILKKLSLESIHFLFNLAKIFLVLLLDITRILYLLFAVLSMPIFKFLGKASDSDFRNNEKLFKSFLIRSQFRTLHKLRLNPIFSQKSLL